MAKKNQKNPDPSLDELTPSTGAPVDNRGTVVRKDKPKKLKKRGKNMVDNTDDVSARYEYLIKTKKVEKDTRHRRVIRALIIFLIALLLLGGGLWGISSFIEYNNFRVVVDRPGQNIFAISPERTLQNAAEIFNIDGPRYMDNITIMGMESVVKEIENSDGAISRDNLIAATFYLTNKTDASRKYKEIIDISDTSQGIEEAIRIMLIKSTYNPDGSPKTRIVNVYAAPHSYDEEGNPIAESVVPLPPSAAPYTGDEIRGIENLGLYEDIRNNEWMTIPFLSHSIAVDNDGSLDGTTDTFIIPPGGFVKYTLMIWLEGNDKDTVDDKIGGRMKLSLTFSEG